MPNSITRQRTGCVVCRKRRIKCDESKPSCQNCIRKSRNCDWTKNLRFVHESVTPAPAEKQSSAFTTSSRKLATATRQHRHSSSRIPRPNGEATIFTVSPSAKRSTSLPSTVLWNELAETATSVLNRSGLGIDSNSSITDSAATEICRSESARLRGSIETEHASPIPPNLDPNPEGFTDWSTLGLSEELQKAFNSDIEMKLLQNYIWECAPWFDAYNYKRNYSKTDIPRMMNCPPWRAAALALSAKNLELCKGNFTDIESLSLHLYQLAVRLAIDSISGRFDCVGTLAGCVLLAVYEMMTVSYTDWRRHAQGCASIYVHNNWNGSTGGLISVSFWEYARIDIWAAYCSSTDTLISPRLWFDQPEDVMSLSNVDESTYAQISTWLLGRTVNLIHQNTANRSCSLWAEFERLREDLSKWESMGSPECRALISLDASPDKDIPFPQILFASHSSFTAYTMFHTAMILLLEFEQSQLTSTNSRLSNALYHHSRIACGVIKSNDRTPCLVSSLQPMWICGRHLRTRAEKFAALEILAQIEKRTGWRCDWRSKGLREYWQIC